MTRLMIGVGNPFRGDDAVGCEVAGRVTAIEAHQCPTGSLELIDLWDGVDEVIVVDAMRSGGTPGEVRRIEALVDELPTDDFVSTHSMGLASVLEIARELGRLPKRMVVYGIEVADIDPGTTMTPAVAAAAERVAAEIDHA